jgi:hypothetical protein
MTLRWRFPKKDDRSAPFAETLREYLDLFPGATRRLRLTRCRQFR